MDCRTGCGACCIAPAIVTPFFGMPGGKPAGVRCVHLSDALRCLLFDDPRRPQACADFQAEALFCGGSREQALEMLSALECSTQPEAHR
ncbi:YkgJ family cysteine cluster protein [Luminiphilus syltensis]|uniref:YkgJ family cysteine cluster protein n=1 Tax=Luminiphilus syltensis TaxID=1341119 RepID=UPI00058B801D|nr:YkgJ family cysteine cluster protein [Luminiphilus syltensis]